MAAEDRTGQVPKDRFPVYRELGDGRAYYRIASERAFTEIQVIGTRRVVHEVEAQVYPEMVRIQEMLDGDVYSPLDKEEWDRQWALCSTREV